MIFDSATVTSAWSRRRFLGTSGAFMASLVQLHVGRARAQTQPPVLPRPAEYSSDGFVVLRARPGHAPLRGGEQTETAIWGYDGRVPGPLLRIRQGEELRTRLINELPQPTVIHWHGIRLPNAMDGVPHLTQSLIESGKSFDYRFIAPDAGTFWYHAHHYSSEQLAHGLYGPLIVDERTPPEIDQDILLVLDDWRLDANGAIQEASPGAMDGPAHLTANSRPRLDMPVAVNDRIRLRLINAASARIMPVRIAGHVPYVVAIDGQPAEPFPADASRVVLAPGNRADLFIDATSEPGSVTPIVIEDYGQRDVEIARLVYDAQARRRANPLPAPRPLPDNPLPARMAFTDALRVEIPLEGAATNAMVMRRGPDAAGPPLFRVRRGRTVVIAMSNRTVFLHAMHLHGHHFRLLDNLDDGWKPFWLDTVLIAPERTTRIAFVADNPGKWMIDYRRLGYQETGMAAWFEVG